jgi:NADPH:quinone reductase-like Zn-dependent oxidoreductase
MNVVAIENGSLALRERPTPTPAPGEVLVATRASGLNAADVLQIAGHYPAPPGWPSDVPGLEVAGEIVAVGDGVEDTMLGDRVCAIVGGGGHASHVLVPASDVLSVPSDVSWAEAGGFAEAYLTAYDALVGQARLAPGERVLITGAAGGVGTAAVQIANSLGADVTAVTRHATHREALHALGADEVISPEEVAQVAPVNVVLELVGAASLAVAQHRLAPFARVVVIGVGGGGRLELHLLELMRTRATLTGSTLRARPADEKARLARDVRRDLLPAWHHHYLNVPVASTWPWTEVVAAYEAFATPGKFGKVVLTWP